MIMQFIAAHRTSVLTRVAYTGLNAGASLVVTGVLAVAAFAAVVAFRAWRIGAAAVCAPVLATLAARILKAIVQRPRPGADLALLPLDGWAMPSTHAARLAALCVAVLVAAGWSASRRWRRAQVALVAAVVVANVVVGALMVYLGAHWPTDVVAGWLLGAAVGWAVARALGRAGRPRRARPARRARAQVASQVP